jgi:hypothetical protein
VHRTRLHVMQTMSSNLPRYVVQTERGNQVEVVEGFNVPWIQFRVLQTVEVSHPLEHHPLDTATR